MTISEAIDRIDAVKPNAYSEGEKKKWLSQLDSMAWRDVLSTHDFNEDETPMTSFDGYTEDTDGDTELLIPDEYGEIYITWLGAKIDFVNQEINRYTNGQIMFNAQWADYCNGWNRSHMPKGQPIKGVGGRVWR